MTIPFPLYPNTSYIKCDKHNNAPYLAYKKKPTAFAEQVDKLISRNMIIDNKTEAIKILSDISYYHLSPYWKPFCKSDSDDFEEGTIFSKIVEIYNFDKELREFLLKYIAPIEVAYKTCFVNYFCMATTDPFAYLIKDNFNHAGKWEQSVNKIIDEFEKSKEDFANHHKKNYPNLMPPLWLVSEFLTLGELNFWVANLKDSVKYLNKSVRDLISDHFGLTFSLFTSFIMSLTNIRNFCAHQCRVWDRNIINQPKQPSNTKSFLYKNMIINFSSGQKKGIYNTLVILAYCLKKMKYTDSFALELISIIKKYNIDPLKMGFPQSWDKLSLWKIDR